MCSGQKVVLMFILRFTHSCGIATHGEKNSPSREDETYHILVSTRLLNSEPRGLRKRSNLHNPLAFAKGNQLIRCDFRESLQCSARPVDFYVRGCGPSQPEVQTRIVR